MFTKIKSLFSKEKPMEINRPDELSIINKRIIESDIIKQSWIDDLGSIDIKCNALILQDNKEKFTATVTETGSVIEHTDKNGDVIFRSELKKPAQ